MAPIILLRPPTPWVIHGRSGRQVIGAPQGAIISGIRGAKISGTRKGFELRRPLADLLRDGIHELRAKRRGINYRMLYFFHGRQAIVVSHGFVKQRSRVPESEIRRAIEHMARFNADPMTHRSVVEI
jgi:hypothetical protein